MKSFVTTQDYLESWYSISVQLKFQGSKMSNQETAGQSCTRSYQNQNPAWDQVITPMKIQILV